MRSAYMWPLVIALSTISSPSLADPQGTAQATPPTAAPKPGATDMICQKIEVTVRRLGSKKVCMTRAQWAQQQLDDRQATEKVQVQRTMPGN